MRYYNYDIIISQHRECILITDLNIGGTSVTNSIESIIQEIEDENQINTKNYLVIYKDSEDVWDGWDSKKNEFVILHSFNAYDAITKYINIKNNGY